MKTLEDKAIESRTTVLPQAKRLEKWKPPVSTRQSKARFRNLLESFRRRNEKDIYEMGKELNWLKDGLPHGEFTPFVVIEMGLPIRTAQRLMKHADECDAVNRYLPYASNTSWKNKRDTVSLLEPPEVQDKSELGIKKPRHDSEPLNWSAAVSAKTLLSVFKKVTDGRKIEELEATCELFGDGVREYIDSRREDKSLMRDDE